MDSPSILLQQSCHTSSDCEHVSVRAAGLGPSASAHARHRAYVPGSLHESSPTPEPAEPAPHKATRAPAESAPAKAVPQAVPRPPRGAERAAAGSSKGVCRKAAGIKDTVPGFTSITRPAIGSRATPAIVFACFLAPWLPVTAAIFRMAAHLLIAMAVL